MIRSKLLWAVPHFRLILRPITSWQLAFDKHGEPLDVLYERQQRIKKLSDGEVLVNFRASPINPSDINTIQGVYPLKPKLPGVPGHEGAGYVVECGKNVQSLRPGDLVIPSLPSAGTWRTLANFEEGHLIKLDPKLPLMNAAVISTNPSTAYLMLKNFVDLKPGDCVIQNGATSSVGIYVIQMCKLFGVHSINLFRPRSTHEETEATRKSLLDYGASLVLTEDELKQSTEAKDLGEVKLAFNCLCGKTTLSLLKHLDNGGVLVTYGAMTRQPIPVPAGPLIFKDLQLRGFWVSGFAKKSSYLKKRLEMLDVVSQWMISGQLRLTPHVEVPHIQWKKAMSESSFKDGTPSTQTKKNVLVFPECK
uniref:Enoyl-[acyl-carrier-protein] reductase, mitochondrial n=2 Tax=Schistocephalus solidus TaxID=70667 RepID=A0A0X3NZE5_SCHSO